MSRRNTQSPGTSKGKEGIGHWLLQLKSWFVMSEPSNQALKQYKKETYRNAGVSVDDPRASAKLQYVSAVLCSFATMVTTARFFVRAAAPN